MRRPLPVVAALSVAVLSTFIAPAWADDDDDDRRWRAERKEEFWDGRCKVERKWKKNGGYKEERKCDGPLRALPYSVYTDASPPFGMTFAPPRYGDDAAGRFAHGARAQYCREYQMDALVNGRPARVYGTACLEPDGSWSIVQ